MEKPRPQGGMRRKRVARGRGPGHDRGMTTMPQDSPGPAPADPQDAYPYQVVARALAHLHARAPAQPPLDEIAAAAGLSPAHFQRVFSRWAGVSPKRYQQYLALDIARRLLRRRFTVLDTAAGAGLSGPGRLHDLFLRWEAMSPGDFARRGAGLTIRHGWFDSPYGPALVMATGRGICGVAFAAETGQDAALADMTGRWPKARYVADPAGLRDAADSLFRGRAEDARLHLIGGPFQIKVWEALLRIPEGHVTTYSEIARAIGQPRAVRAVGSAVGRNPLALLIPCHRVLRRDGGLGGYHWGLGVKRAMLLREAARTGAALTG